MPILVLVMNQAILRGSAPLAVRLLELSVGLNPGLPGMILRASFWDIPVVHVNRVALLAA